MSREEPVPTGLCPVCQKPTPKTAGRYGEVDAFDTSRCCRSWFGTSLKVDKTDVKLSVLAANRTGGFRDRQAA